MCKLWVQSPEKRKVAFRVRQSSSEDSKGEVGEAQPNFTGLPAHHLRGPLLARAEGMGGPQAFIVLKDTQSFPFPSPRLLRGAGATILQELGSVGGKQPHLSPIAALSEDYLMPLR